MTDQPTNNAADLLSTAIDMITWMSGANDFTVGGAMHDPWINYVRPEIARLQNGLEALRGGQND